MIAVLGYFVILLKPFPRILMVQIFIDKEKRLMVNKKINIANYFKLSKGQTDTSKKVSIFSIEDVLMFIHKSAILIKKVAIIFGIFSGCRRQELKVC